MQNKLTVLSLRLFIPNFTCTICKLVTHEVLLPLIQDIALLYQLVNVPRLSYEVILFQKEREYKSSKGQVLISDPEFAEVTCLCGDNVLHLQSRFDPRNDPTPLDNNIICTDKTCKMFATDILGREVRHVHRQSPCMFMNSRHGPWTPPKVTRGQKVRLTAYSKGLAKYDPYIRSEEEFNKVYPKPIIGWQGSRLRSLPLKKRMGTKVRLAAPGWKVHVSRVRGVGTTIHIPGPLANAYREEEAARVEPRVEPSATVSIAPKNEHEMESGSAASESIPSLPSAPAPVPAPVFAPNSVAPIVIEPRPEMLLNAVTYTDEFTSPGTVFMTSQKIPNPANPGDFSDFSEVTDKVVTCRPKHINRKQVFTLKPAGSVIGPSQTQVFNRKHICR